MCGTVLFTVTVAASASASSITLDVVGSNPAGNALDPGGNNIGGIPTITWTLNADASGPATLSIVAEGVDGGASAPNGGEHDEVFFNGVSIGFLTQQDFYATVFNLQPGPGALAGITALTTSGFAVNALPGLNTISVQVDSHNWVNEIETASLTSVPEPATLWLSGLGIAAALKLRRRNRA